MQSGEKWRWGKGGNCRLNPNAGTASDREAARELLAANRENKGVFLKEVVNLAQSTLLNYRCTVGKVNETIPGFPLFMVEGQGDTWEEAFADADKNKDRRGY